MVTKTREKTREEFYCKICDYGCRDKYNMTRHLSSTKHQMVTNGNKNEAKRGKPYICHCGKVYKFRSGLSRHKKKCSPQNIIMDQTSMNDDSPCSGSEILELCKTMKKLVELHVDINPSGSNIRPSSAPSLSASTQAEIQLCLLRELIRGSSR